MNYFEAVMKECGYTPMTTFWNDFSIADKCGIDAIKDTFKRAFEEWKSDVKYLTELVMVLNHKIWYWYNKDEEYGKVYDELWRQADDWCRENLTGGRCGLLLSDNRLDTKSYELQGISVRRIEENSFWILRSRRGFIKREPDKTF